MQFGRWTVTTRNGYIPGGIPASAGGLKPVTTRSSGIGNAGGVLLQHADGRQRKLLQSGIRDDP